MLTITLVLVVQSFGCATAEQRHRVLTFFFDGVPPLASDEPEVVAGDLPELGESQLALAQPVARSVSVHGPVAEKECDECHESAFSNRLRKTDGLLCWSCHDPEDFPGDQRHGPVAGGLCNGCHDPHRSPNPFLLVSKPEEICSHCHNQQTFAAIADHRAEKGSDCQRCHDVHASDRKYMLTDDADSP